MKYSLLLFFISMSVVASACQDKGPEQVEDAAGAEEVYHDASTPTPKADLLPLTKEITQRQGFSKAVVQALIAAQLPLKHSSGSAAAHPEVLSGFLNGLERSVFFNEGHFTQKGQGVLAELMAVDRHGLDPEDYKVNEIDALYQELTRLRDEIDGQELTLSPQDLQGLVEFVESSELDLSAESASARLASIIGAEDLSPGLTQWRSQLAGQVGKYLETAAQLELLLIAELLHFHNTLSLSNLNILDDEEVAAFGKEPNTEAKQEILVQRQQRDLQELAALDPDDNQAIQAYLMSKWPQHEQYARLLEVRDRYQGIC